MGSEGNNCRLVGCQNNNLKFRSRHLIKVMYESDHISFLLDSTLNKKDHVRRKINSEKKYMRNQYYYFDLPKVRVVRVRTTKN